MSELRRSKNGNDLSDHSGLVENNPEVKSFIYQQINEFNPYVTSETVIMVIARDPSKPSENLDELPPNESQQDFKHRIAIVLQEKEATLEAEAYHDNIYEAIKLAKVNLIDRLVEIQVEMDEQKELEIETEETYERKSESFH